MMPLVSVVTASHLPDPSFLGEAYVSLVSQSHSNWEWLLCLDGPGSLIDCVPEQIRGDRRVRVSANGDRLGAAITRNMALVRSGGAFVVNLDADDTYSPIAIEALIDPMVRNLDVGVAFGRNRHLRPDGELIAGSPPEALLPADYRPGVLPAGYLPDLWLMTSYHHTSTSHAAYRRDIALAVGGWGALQRMEDLFLLLMAADLRDAYFVDEVVGHYRIHDHQVTGVQPAGVEREARSFLAEHILCARALRGEEVSDWSYVDRDGTRRQFKAADRTDD